MRWIFKPVPTLKMFAATLSMWTMCIAPVAQGAEAANNNKQLINQYLKESGLTTQKITIGEFWGRVRHIYPPTLQKQLDPWMTIHKKELMPTITASSFKDTDNKEQVRLIMTSGHESGTLTFTGDEEQPLKINSVTVSREELANYNKFDQLMEKVVKQDPTLSKAVVNSTGTEKRFLKGRDIAKLPLRQQMEYFLKMRSAVESADRVLDLNKGQKGAAFDYSTPDSAVAALWRVLLGASAQAKIDQACIASGWVASYFKGSCAHADQGQATLLRQVADLPFSANVKNKVSSCATGGGLPCNPLLFGFSDNSGSPICIKSSLITATQQCNSAVPLPGSKEKIIQSIVAARGGDGSLCKVKDGSTVSESCVVKLDTYTKNLQEHYLNAARFCTKGGVSNIESRAEWEAKARTDIRKDQKEACDNLKDRFFDLKVEAGAPAAGAGDNCAKIPGSHAGEGGACLCADGSVPHPEGQKVKKAGKHTKGHKGEIPLPPPPSPDDGAAVPADSDGQLTCIAVAGGDDAGGAVEAGNKDLPGGKAVKGNTCGFFCRNKGLFIAAGVGLLGLGLMWWLTKKKPKNSTPVYVAPAPPPLVDPTVAPTVVAPVPVNPCPAPSTVINGVCTAPIYVPPSPVVTTPAPSAEGGTGTGPSGGAVR